MPMQVVIRFKCDTCQIETGVIGTLEVDGFPAEVPIVVKEPVKGWTVEGKVAKCPEHSRRVVVAKAEPPPISRIH